MNRKRVLWIAGIAACCALALPLATAAVMVFVAQPVRFEGTSMEPTYHGGDGIMLRKSFGELERGDVVAFLYPKDTTKSFIKRVVALAGDRIEIRGGKVFVNDAELSEPYVTPERNQQSVDLKPTTVEADHVFVMGDNRDLSNDSRNWGAVPTALVYAKVWFRYVEASERGRR